MHSRVCCGVDGTAQILRQPGISQRSLGGRNALLAAFDKNQASDQQKFAIESAIVNLGREYFDTLGREQGPVNAMVEVDNDPGRTHLLPPSLTLACRWFTLPWLADSPDQPDAVELIGRTKDTGHESILDYFPVGRFVGVSGGFDVPPVRLPKSLPTGPYHVFLRFLQDGKILGDGHGFDMDQNGVAINREVARITASAQE